MAIGVLEKTNLDQIITSKRAKLGPDNNLTAYIYIYIYAVKLLSGPSLAISKVIIWAKFAFLKTLFAKNTIKIGVSALFFEKKSVHKNFQSYYLGQVDHFYVATNLAQIITLTWPS